MQDNFQRKSLAKKKCDREGSGESRQEYKELQFRTKREVKTRQKEFDELQKRLDCKEGED